MNIPLPRLVVPIWLVALAALALAAACGGSDDSTNNVQHGALTDPQNVPTATPWQNLPDVVQLDPSNLATLPPQQPNQATPTPTAAPGEPGVCGATYTVVSGDTTFGIADKCGVSVDDLINANPDADPRSLSVGQVLQMPAKPAGTGGATPTPTS